MVMITTMTSYSNRKNKLKIIFSDNIGFNTHNESGYIMIRDVTSRQPTKLSVKKRFKNTYIGLTILYKFKRNEIEFNINNLIIANMMMYPNTLKEHEIKQAEKLLDHYKRNHVRVNRLT